MKTDPDLVLKIIGRKIKSRRKALKWKQQDFCQMVDLTRTSISNIESGRQNIGIDRLVQIADAFQCDLKDLIPKIR